MNRISNESVKNLLGTLVAIHEKFNIEELALCFLNKKRGEPRRSDMLDSRRAPDLEKAKDGFYVCGPTITAYALHDLSPETVNLVLENRNR